jgi:hypothetical protein
VAEYEMRQLMTKKEKQALSNYIRAMADWLWLRDWDFDVYFERVETDRDTDEDQGWGATVDQTRHRQHASITLPPDFRYNPVSKGHNGKQTIAHELIHMHFARLWDMARMDMREMNGISQDVYDLFIMNFERNMEYGVDSLAYAFAEHMPDIDWTFTEKPKKKRKKKKS